MPSGYSGPTIPEKDARVHDGECAQAAYGRDEEYLRAEGIKLHTLVRYGPESNGVAELEYSPTRRVPCYMTLV